MARDAQDLRPDSETFDLFLSYRRHDAERVRPLVEALRARGLRVWQDVAEIDTFDGIQRAIQTGLARSRALLVWYSATYNDSRACQWELTQAYLAAQADPETAGNPRRRVLVVNPEASGGHIVLPALFDQLHLKATEHDTAALAERIAAHLAQQVPATPLGHLRALTAPPMLPSPLIGSTRFVGRLRWMWQLHATLQAGEAAMLTGVGGSGQSGLVQVRGAGGIGKSLLAEEYALRFGAAYPGGIFWIRAEGYTDRDDGQISAADRLSRLEGQLIGFAQLLNLPISGLSPLEVKGLLTGHLGRQGLPFLWIVDDLPADPGPDGLAPWLAPHPLGRTLITTRARRFNHVSLIELPQLDEAEALRLLARGKPLGEADRPVAEVICRELGHHALAVDVAAALIELRGFTGFLSRLQQASAEKDVLEVAARLDEALPNGHQRSIAATLLASLRELDAPTLDVLLLAALLAPSPIPRDLIWRTLAQADALDADDAQDLCDPALGRALATSLADPSDGGGIVVHTLVSRTLRLHEPDAARTEPLRSAAVTVLNQEMPRAADIREHASLKDWLPHAHHLGSALSDVETLNLFGWVGRFYDAQGQYSAAQVVRQQELEASRRVLGDEHPDTLASINNLALTFFHHGNLAEARKLQETALGKIQQVRGNEHPDTLTLMNNLVLTMCDQGDLTGARKLQETALETMRYVLGDEHSITRASMNNLALILWNQGDLAGARKLQDNVLEVQQRILGNEHPDTLTSMNNLANTLRSQGDLTGARLLQEVVLEIRQHILGEEHPDTLSSINDLACTWWDQGDLVAAQKLQETALEIRKRVLGEEHLDTLTSMNNLANTLRRQGDLIGARSLHETALEARRRILGEEHPDTLGSINNLACICWDQRDLAGAQKLQESVLAVQQRVLGEYHPDTFISMNNLANTLSKQGDSTGAIFLHKAALEARQHVLGKEHPDTLQSASNLAYVLRGQGDLAGARELLLSVLTVLRRTLGDRGNDTSLAAWNMWAVLQQLGEFDAATQLRTELLDWLLTSPLEKLSGQQQQIAQMLSRQVTPKIKLAFKYQFKLSS